MDQSYSNLELSQYTKRTETQKNIFKVDFKLGIVEWPGLQDKWFMI